MLPEGRDETGFVWIRELRFPDYFHLQDFDNLVVEKVYSYREGDAPPECWEATIFEDEKCQKILGKQEFNTEREAKEFLEYYVVTKLKGKL